MSTRVLSSTVSGRSESEYALRAASASGRSTSWGRCWEIKYTRLRGREEGWMERKSGGEEGEERVKGKRRKVGKISHWGQRSWKRSRWRTLDNLASTVLVLTVGADEGADATRAIIFDAYRQRVCGPQHLAVRVVKERNIVIVAVRSTCSTCAASKFS